MMTQYVLLMWAYNLLALFIVMVVVYNLFKSGNFWEQIISFFIIIPFMFRFLMIK